MWKVYANNVTPFTRVFVVLPGGVEITKEYSGDPESYYVADYDQQMFFDGSHVTSIENRRCLYSDIQSAVRDCAKCIHLFSKKE